MDEQSIKVKDLPLLDRPREKLLRQGVSTLTNAELLAILFGSGTKNTPLMRICKELNAAINNDPTRLLHMTPENFSQIRGIGQVKATILLASLELGKRALTVKRPLVLKEADDIKEFLLPYLSNCNHNCYILLLLNHRNELLAMNELELGKDQLPQLKPVIKLALEAGAAALMVCRKDTIIPDKILNKEKAFITQLDAAAGMLNMKMNGLMVIQ